MESPKALKKDSVSETEIINRELFGTKTDEEKVKSKRRLEYLIERGDENHCYVKKWLKQSFIPQIQADPSFYSWRNNTGLSKELTEAWGTYKAVKFLVAKLREKLPDLPEDKLVFIDMCSGKGFNSTLLSFKYPQSSIHMIDNNKKIKVDHVKSLPNVKWHLKNIKEPNLTNWVDGLIGGDGKVGILLGVHLCGSLSEILVDVYNTSISSKALALCPCCVNKLHPAIIAAKETPEKQHYVLWCNTLFNDVCGTKEMRDDPKIASEKSTEILAWKHQSQPDPPQR